MKISFLLLSVLLLNTGLQEQSYQRIKAKDAKRYIGKEVIVVGKLIDQGNSSYLQSAWFDLGQDTFHNQLRVLVQGEFYSKAKTRARNYIGKEVQVRGIVKVDRMVYLDATDTLKLFEGVK